MCSAIRRDRQKPRQRLHSSRVVIHRDPNREGDADHAQDISRPRGRRRWCGAHASHLPAAAGAGRCQAPGFRRRSYLPSARSVRRCVEAVRAGYPDKPDDAKLIEFGDQQHAQRPRSPLELHGREELSRAANPDQGPVRRARPGGHHGGRFPQGGGRRSTIRRRASWRAT